MNLSELARRDVGWLSGGDGNPCIISTRIRLARNLKGFSFPSTSPAETLRKIRERVFRACKSISLLKKAENIRLEECDDIDRQLLLERNLVSRGLAFSSRPGGILLGDRELMSIMINEEDHLRAQYISAGLNLFDSWDVINRLDDDLGGLLDYAYSGKWGYLTSCPTNTGTGMRASCLLHLPGLGMTGSLGGTMENINKLGMVVRGIYGEGTRVMGNILQVSNQVTLGVSETRVIDSLKRLVVQVVERERKVSSKILETGEETVKDSVYRSHGVLVNAYKISFEEAMDFMSNLRFGVYNGIIKRDLNTLNNLMIKIQPAHIQQIEGSCMNDSEMDIARARLIRNALRKSGV